MEQVGTVARALAQNRALWRVGYFKLKEFEQDGRIRKVPLTSSPPFSPEAAHKILMCGVPSILGEQRSVLIAKGRGMPGRIQTNGAC